MSVNRILAAIVWRQQPLYTSDVERLPADLSLDRRPTRFRWWRSLENCAAYSDRAVTSGYGDNTYSNICHGAQPSARHRFDRIRSPNLRRYGDGVLTNFLRQSGGASGSTRLTLFSARQRARNK